VDEAVRTLLVAAEERAAEVLRRHQDGVSQLIAKLEEMETLDREDIEACLGPAQPHKKRQMEASSA
jgi:ATP-dependent Zn protease